MLTLRVGLLADGASLDEMAAVEPLVAGFTTNPSLMRRAGVENYHAFAQAVLRIAKDKPVSFEVLSDDFDEMAREARIIASWGRQVFVKIPITNTKGASSGVLIHQLAREGVQLNVTAIMHRAQVEVAVGALNALVPSFISIFAGRVADTGLDPMPFMAAMVPYAYRSQSAIVWASTREIYNVVQANDCGCSYITVSPEILRKLPLLGRDVLDYSLDTVREFYRDATEYRLS